MEISTRHQELQITKKKLARLHKQKQASTFVSTGEVENSEKPQTKGIESSKTTGNENTILEEIPKIDCSKNYRRDKDKWA